MSLNNIRGSRIFRLKWVVFLLFSIIVKIFALNRWWLHVSLHEYANHLRVFFSPLFFYLLKISCKCICVSIHADALLYRAKKWICFHSVPFIFFVCESFIWKRSDHRIEYYQRDALLLFDNCIANKKWLCTSHIHNGTQSVHVFSFRSWFVRCYKNKSFLLPFSYSSA